MSPLVNWLTDLPRLSGSGLPCHFSSSGFGSNRSIWLRPADHEQEDDALRLRLEVRLLRGERVGRSGAAAASRRGPQPGQGDAAEAAAGAEQEVAAVGRRGDVRRHAVRVRGRPATPQAALSPGEDHDLARRRLDRERLARPGPGTGSPSSPPGLRSSNDASFRSLPTSLKIFVALRHLDHRLVVFGVLVLAALDQDGAEDPGFFSPRRPGRRMPACRGWRLFSSAIAGRRRPGPPGRQVISAIA